MIVRAFRVAQPSSLDAALGLMRDHPTNSGVQDHLAVGASNPWVWLAGGQSLLAAMKLGMSEPDLLIDLQNVQELYGVEVSESMDLLTLGAMTTHAQVASADAVKGFCPGLIELAKGIADQQVRNMGTIGGSLANNDPAACWPAAVLALKARIITSARELEADDFFQSVFTTSLALGELLIKVSFPKPDAFCYLKFEQPASRFALVGVAVARFGCEVRIAVTGLGQGVVRWFQAEQALHQRFYAEALEGLAIPDELALSDLHASAKYRAHLAGVLCRRAVASITGEVLKRPVRKVGDKPKTRVLEPVQLALLQGHSKALPEPGFGGSFQLKVSPEIAWEALFNPVLLLPCIPGCETLSLVRPNQYVAKIKVGLGPLAARFSTRVDLQDLKHPESLVMVFQGSAGALGSGRGQVTIFLHRESEGTRFDWHAQVHTSGRLAQLGNRLMEASARKLSGDFFARFEVALKGPRPSTLTTPLPDPFSEAGKGILSRFKALFSRAWRRLVNILQGK